MSKRNADDATESNVSVLHNIYKREVSPQEPEIHCGPGGSFTLFRNPFMEPGHLLAIIGQFGLVGSLKALTKLATRKRDLFVYFVDGKIASFGWIMHGDCRHYQIESDASVVGPIYTNETFRGKGYVVTALIMAMAQLSKLGHCLFYIDVDPLNIASEKAIRKAGFCGPVGTAAVPGPANEQ